MFGEVEATEPETLSVLLVAPALACVIVPETGPAGAVDLRRTLTCVPSEPSIEGVRLRLGKKLVPSELISKLAGAVTVTVAVRLLPLTA